MRTALTAALVIAATACVDPDDPPPDEVAGEATPLFGGERPSTFGVFEVGKTYTRDYLSVCWMPNVLNTPQLEIPILRPVAEQIVMREWGRVGRVRFSPPPWRSCEDWPTSDIRIGLHPPAGSLGWSAIGTNADSIPIGAPTMRLYFGPWGAGCVPHGVGAACDDDNDEGPEDPEPYIDYQKFRWVVLHEFGHALGLRHEFAHEDAFGCDYEPLEVHQDGIAYDGQSLFGFQPDSVMSYCSGLPDELSPGDILALHVLYPGVVGLFTAPDHNSAPIYLGPGQYTAANLRELGSVRSIVVPAGYRVRICSATACTYASTTRILPPGYDAAVRSIQIEPGVMVTDEPGLQGVGQVMYATSNAPFGSLGNDMMSSLFAATTRRATVCTDRAAGGACRTFTGGAPFEVDSVIFPPHLDNAITHVGIENRVVTYDAEFSGVSTALGLGVYRASSHAGFPHLVDSLAISGLKVRACTEEGPPGAPGGAGDCRTYTQSVNLVRQDVPHQPIRFLEVTN